MGKSNYLELVAFALLSICVSAFSSCTGEKGKNKEPNSNINLLRKKRDNESNGKLPNNDYYNIASNEATRNNVENKK